MTDTPHTPYNSLESFRLALVDTYLQTYSSDVVVQEKIHGSNTVILGYISNGTWEFKLGSRKKWLNPSDKFNNFHTIFNH